MLGETTANLEQAERELQRNLAAKEAISRSALDKSEADAKALRARLERQVAEITVAEREVALWKQQLDDTIIRAPSPASSHQKMPSRAR